MLWRFQTEQICQVDHGHDAAAQVQHPRNLRTAQRHARYICQSENGPDLLDWQPEQLPPACESHIIRHPSLTSCRAAVSGAAIEKKIDVNNLGSHSTNECVAERALPFPRYIHLEWFLGNVDDLINEQAYRATVFRKYKDRLSGLLFDLRLRVETE